tara:strand:+ start:259 stop:789 length:531 start_codon:yes stop_codon:yes gene_type:complete
MMRRQIRRFSEMLIEIDYRPKKGKRIIHKGLVFSKIQLEKDDKQLPLFASETQFSAEFYNSLVQLSMPFCGKHIRSINNALTLDVYLWLAIRLPQVPNGSETEIRFASIIHQFGITSTTSNFIKSFETAVRNVLDIWTEARGAVVVEGRGKKKVVKLRHVNDVVALRDKDNQIGWK